ncbi:MAG: hypothetical protein LW629_03955 [Burkholderiales bacterium]|nr:hypothetical protein [Burkholderiales bacterium]
MQLIVIASRKGGVATPKALSHGGQARETRVRRVLIPLNRNNWAPT